MTVEEIWYEAAPYAYLLVGGIVLLDADSAMSIASGALLVVAALTIIRLRWRHRRSSALAKASTESGVRGHLNAATGSRVGRVTRSRGGVDHVR